MRNKDPRPIHEREGILGKDCSVCRNFRSIDGFNNDKRSRDGYSQSCRECRKSYHATMTTELGKKSKSERNKKRYNEDPVYRARIKSYTANYWLTPKGRADRLWRGAVKNKRRWVEGTNLTFEHVLRGVERGYCAVTGIPFDFSSPPPGKQYNSYAPSLDRINPKLPYTDENVRVVIWQFNLMKGEVSDEELLAFAKLTVMGLEKKND